MNKKRNYFSPIVLTTMVESMAGIAVTSNTDNELPVFTENTQNDWNFD